MARGSGYDRNDQDLTPRPAGGAFIGRLLRNGVGALALLALAAGPAWAEGKEKDKEPGNLIRTTVMVPLLNPGTTDIARILPIAIDINFDTEEAKNTMVNSIPKLQAAYIEGAYGKIFTNWGYDRIQNLFKGITEELAGEDVKNLVHVTIRLNPKQQ